MNLLPLPAFTDNYIWMLHDGRQAIVVDPGDSAPVLQALQHLGVQLKAILVTHHHADHVGGVDAVRSATGAVVYGPAREKIPEPLHRLAHGDAVETMGLRFEVMDVPGHTAVTHGPGARHQPLPARATTCSGPGGPWLRRKGESRRCRGGTGRTASMENRVSMQILHIACLTCALWLTG